MSGARPKPTEDDIHRATQAAAKASSILEAEGYKRPVCWPVTRPLPKVLITAIGTRAPTAKSGLRAVLHWGEDLSDDTERSGDAVVVKVPENDVADFTAQLANAMKSLNTKVEQHDARKELSQAAADSAVKRQRLGSPVTPGPGSVHTGHRREHGPRRLGGTSAGAPQVTGLDGNGSRLHPAARDPNSPLREHATEPGPGLQEPDGEVQEHDPELEELIDRFYSSCSTDFKSKTGRAIPPQLILDKVQRSLKNLM